MMHTSHIYRTAIYSMLQVTSTSLLTKHPRYQTRNGSYNKVDKPSSPSMYHPLDQNSQEFMHSISVLSSMPFTTLRSVLPHPGVTQKHDPILRQMITWITSRPSSSSVRNSILWFMGPPAPESPQLLRQFVRNVLKAH